MSKKSLFMCEAACNYECGRVCVYVCACALICTQQRLIACIPAFEPHGALSSLVSAPESCLKLEQV